MGRKICVFIVGLVLIGLAGEVRGQLPIYQQWSREYQVYGIEHLTKDVQVVSINLATGSSPPLEYAVSVYSDTAWGYPGNPFPYSAVGYYLCAVDTSDVLWQANVSSSGFWGSMSVYVKLPPLALENGNIVSLYTETSGTSGSDWLACRSLQGDSLWSFELPSGFYFPKRLIAVDRGIIVPAFEDAIIVSREGDSLDYTNYEATGYYLSCATNTASQNVFVRAFHYNPTTRVSGWFNTNLDFSIIDTLDDAYGSSYAEHLASGQIITAGLGPTSESGYSIRLIRYDQNGGLQAYQDFANCRITALSVTSEGVICLGATRSDGSHSMIIFANENLDSIGTLENLPSQFTLCSDADGGIVIATPNPSGFALRKYGPTETSANEIPSIPDNIEISAYPNPFNASTTFSFDIPELSIVHLDIYDITGRLVSTLMDQPAPAGSYTKSFDASNMASGVYIYSFRANDFSKHGKVLLLK